MSLASSRAKSVVELSESPLFAHSYSSISQCIRHLGDHYEDFDSLLRGFQSHWLKDYPKQTRYLFQIDGTPLEKPHSPYLSERQYIKIPNNVIAMNKSLSIGYNYSYVNLSYTPDLARGGSRWSLPISVSRIDLENDAISCAKTQVKSLVSNKDLPFSAAELLCMASDSGYTTPRYIAPMVEMNEAIVVNTRFRHGSKVWQQVTNTTINEPKPAEVTNLNQKNTTENTTENITETAEKIGAKQVYGKTTYYLQTSSDVKVTKNGKTKVEGTKNCTAIYDLAPNETLEIKGQTHKKRATIIQLSLWKNMMIRTKSGNNMKDKPFNLIASRVIDAQTGELIFQKPLFIGIFGKKKDQITLQEGYNDYRLRYDIEPYNRFQKQDLLLDKFQTPEVANLDHWTLICASAYWLLFNAADEVDTVVKPWERNLPIHKQQSKQQTNQDNELKSNPKKSVAQVKKGAFELFSTFDRKPFAPKSVNNGKGRKIGTIITKRKKYKVLRKADFKIKNVQIE